MIALRAGLCAFALGGCARPHERGPAAPPDLGLARIEHAHLSPEEAALTPEELAANDAERQLIRSKIARMEPAPPNLAGPDHSSMIVAPANGDLFLRIHHSDWGPPTFWIPSTTEVRGMERDLSNELRTFGFKPGYKRQFVGVVQGDHRFIWGNYFCEARGADWHRQAIGVDDGGSCFFDVEYDPAKRRLLRAPR